MPCYCKDIQKINKDLTVLQDMFSEFSSLKALDTLQASGFTTLS